MCSIGALKPVKAHAISNNNFWIPQRIVDDMEANDLSNCDRPDPPTSADPDPQYNYAQYRWISPAGAYKTTSTTPSLNVDYGQSSVGLSINYLTNICNANINGPHNNTYPYFHGGIQTKDKKITRFTNVAGSTSSTMNGQPFGTITGLDGQYADVSYADGYANNWRYMTNSDSKPFHIDFTLSGLSGLSVGLHTITVKTDVRVVHKWINNKFVCVEFQDPNDSGNASDLNDAKCRKGPTQMTIILNVQPPEDKSPSAAASTTCGGIILSGVEDPNQPNKDLPFDVYYSPGPGAFIITGTANGSSNDAAINLRGVVPPGTTVDIGVYNYDYQDVNDNTKAKWVTYTWSPDANCPPPYTITAVPTIGLTPDDENPDTFSPSVEFTANFPWGTNYKISGIDLTCEFYILKQDGTKPLSGTDDHLASVFDSPTSYKQSCSKAGGYTPLSTYNLKAGDLMCIKYSASPGSGNIELPAGNMITPGGAIPNPAVPYCVPIKNKPYVSAFGGDISAGMGFGNGSCTTTTASIKGFTRNRLGAGTQLAALATDTQAAPPASGTGNSFVSKAMTAGAATDLWFANAGVGAGNVGGFASLPCIHDYVADGNVAGATTSVSQLGAPTPGQVNIPATSGKYKVDLSGTPVLTKLVTSTLTAGSSAQKIELYVDGDVYITGNISYGTGALSREELPSFKLVAKGNIYIDKAVTRLDGVYVAQPIGAARGTIYTCADSSGPIALGSVYDQCLDQLTVNGAFVAKEVRLLRTFGSLRNAGASQNPYTGSNTCNNKTGDTTGNKLCAAEVFNYSPDSFLGVDPETAGGGGPGTTDDYITTLPPIL